MASGMKPAAVALGAAAAGVAVWSTLIERQLFTVRRHTLPVLAPGAAPLRVLQLSDLHLAPWQARKIDWVRSLAALAPDLVVLTGDLMGHIQARGALLYALQPLIEAAPTVFVHGSNDYYGPIFKNPVKYLLEPSRMATRTPDVDNRALTDGLEGLGAININNAATALTLRGTDVQLLGLNDPHIRYDDVNRMRESLAGLETPPSAPRPLRLGVLHAPYQAPLGELLDDGADVILAGHTHGGQVRLPGVGALTANCDLPNAQARGLSVWYDAHRAAFLNVSAGLGNSIYAPIRFACRPEASLLTLEATN